MGNAGTIQPLHKTHFHGWGSWKKASVDKLELLFFACASHDSHTRGRQMEAHSVGSKTKKEKKNSLLQAHVSCARLQVQQLQDKKNGGDPWMCGGYKHTQAHAVAIFSLVAMRGQCYDILREPQLPPPTTIPKILQWLPPRRTLLVMLHEFRK